MAAFDLFYLLLSYNIELGFDWREKRFEGQQWTVSDTVIYAVTAQAVHGFREFLEVRLIPLARLVTLHVLR